MRLFLIKKSAGSMRPNLLLSLIMGILILVSCQTEDDNAFILEPELTILDYISANQERFSCFFRVIQKAGLASALNAYNPYGLNYTLFLPDDDAFYSFIEGTDRYGTFDDLLNDIPFLKTLVLFHVVNSQYNTNDFAHSAIKDTTISGDYLTIRLGVAENNLDILFHINNDAIISEPNIELLNGTIHVIDGVLRPVTYSTYEWLLENENFTIFTELLEKTGLIEQLGVTRLNEMGQTVRNRFTLFVEPDSVFAKRGIHSFNDLVERFGSASGNYTDENDSLYMFAAYHFVEGAYFIEQIRSGLYNTFTVFPIRFHVGMDIQLNRGFGSIVTGISGTDTSFIDYVPLNYDLSDQSTLNGPVHIISEILELFEPPRSTVRFQFYNEPAINTLMTTTGSYFFEKPELMEVLNWGGAKDGLWYIRSASPSEDALNQDYLRIEGNFWLTYRVPRIRPGNYRISIRCGTNNSRYAVIQLYVNGQRLGYPVNLTSYVDGSGALPYTSFIFGPVRLEGFREHTIRVEAVVPGIFIWDEVAFIPF